MVVEAGGEVDGWDEDVEEGDGNDGADQGKEEEVVVGFEFAVEVPTDGGAGDAGDYGDAEEEACDELVGVVSTE